jgi:hypothetical protein
MLFFFQNQERNGLDRYHRSGAESGPLPGHQEVLLRRKSDRQSGHCHQDYQQRKEVECE